MERLATRPAGNGSIGRPTVQATDNCSVIIPGVMTADKCTIRGCVTPVNINSWKQQTEGDLDLVDGYEELSDEHKEKVERALANGHVDDEDWKGV